MGQKQAAIKVGQAYIPVEVDFSGLGARMKKEIDTELKKVGRTFELPADGLKIPVVVETKGGKKVIDQIVPSEREVKSRVSKLSGALKSLTAKGKSFKDATKYFADGVSAKQFNYDATGLERAIGKTRKLLDVTEKWGNKLADIRSKPVGPRNFDSGFGGAAKQVNRKLLPIVSRDVAKAAADALENQLEGGLIDASGRIADEIGQKANIEGPLRKQVRAVAEEAGKAAKQLTGQQVREEVKAERKKAAAARKALLERLRLVREADKAAQDRISGKSKPPAGQTLKGGGFIPHINVSKNLKGYKAIFDEIQRINAFSKTIPGGDEDGFRENLLKNSEVAKKYAREYQGLMRVVAGKGPWTKAADEAKEYLHTVERVNRNTNLAKKSLTQLALDSRKAWATAVLPLEKLKSLSEKVSKAPLGLPRGVTKQTAEIAATGKVKPRRQRAFIDKRTETGAIEAGGLAPQLQKKVEQAWGKVEIPKKAPSEARKFFSNLGRYTSGLARSAGIKAISKYGKLTDGQHALRVKDPGDAGRKHGVEGLPELAKIDTKLVKFAKRGKNLMSGVGKSLSIGFKGAGLAIRGAVNLAGFAAGLTAKMASAGASAGRALASGIRAGLSTAVSAVTGVAGAITSKLGAGLKAGFTTVGGAAGKAIKFGLSKVKVAAESFIKGGVDSFKHLGRRAGQAMSLAMGIATTYAAKTGVSTAAHFETAEVGMTTMLGSAEKAKGMLNDLAQFSARTPFELRGIVDSSKQLLAYGFKAEQIMPILRDVGDASGALGLGNEGVDRITRALGQFKVKGRVMAEEMLQLTETGIPAYEILAEHYGKTIREVTDMVHKGEVDAETGIEALRKGMHKRYQGLMERQAETLSGIMSNIRDQFALTTKDLFLPMVPQTKKAMKGVLDALTKTATFAQTEWPAIWQKLSTDPLGYLNEIFPAIKAKWNGYDWKGLWGKTVAAFKYVWDGLAGIAKQIDWKGVGKTLWDAAVAGLAAAYDMAKKLGNMFLDWFTSVNWGDVGKAVFEGLGKAMAFLNDERGDLFANIGNRIFGSLGDTDWAAEGFKLGDALRNGLLQVWESTVNLGERLRNWVSSVDWGQVWSNISDFSSAFFSGLFGGSGDATQDIAAWFNNIDWEGIKGQAVGWYEGFASMLSGAWDATVTTVGDWTGRLVEWFAGVDWAAVGVSIREGMVSAWEQLLEWVGQAGVWLWEHLWPAIDWVIQLLADPKTWAVIVDVLVWLLEASLDLIIATSKKIVEWFKAIDWAAVGKWVVNLLISLLESIWTIIIKVVVGLGKLIWKIFKDWWPVAFSALGAALDGVWRFFTGWVEGVVGWMMEKFNEGISAIGKAFLDMFPGAKQLVESIGGVIGFNVNAEPPKKTKPASLPSGKVDTKFLEDNLPKTQGVDYTSPTVVNQYFEGRYIEPRQAQHAAMLGIRAGV